MEDLLKTAKQMEYLIDALPADKDLDKQSKTENAKSNGVPGQVHLDVDSDPELLALEAEMQQVNQEYLLVLKEAGQCEQASRRLGNQVLTRFPLRQRKRKSSCNRPCARCWMNTISSRAACSSEYGHQKGIKIRASTATYTGQVRIDSEARGKPQLQV